MHQYACVNLLSFTCISCAHETLIQSIAERSLGNLSMLDCTFLSGKSGRMNSMSCMSLSKHLFTQQLYKQAVGSQFNPHILFIIKKLRIFACTCRFQGKRW